MGYQTPNIDRLAIEGMKFTDYYCEQSCTAGRAAFVTGQSPFRTGLTNVRDGGLRVGLNRVSQIIYQLFIFVALSSLIWAPHDLPAHDLRPEDIVTIFPKDAIPAILSPSFEEGSEVSWLKGKEAVIGIEINGDSRAYPVSILRRVEIINDRVGGIPIAVSW